jgi:hypothetical protein
VILIGLSWTKSALVEIGTAEFRANGYTYIFRIQFRISPSAFADGSQHSGVPLQIVEWSVIQLLFHLPHQWLSNFIVRLNDGNN